MAAKTASIAANTIPTGLDHEPISKMAEVPTIKKTALATASRKTEFNKFRAGFIFSSDFGDFLWLR